MSKAATDFIKKNIRMNPGGTERPEKYQSRSYVSYILNMKRKNEGGILHFMVALCESARLDT